MVILCDGCGEKFEASEIFVEFPDRFWCSSCKPGKARGPMLITVLLTLQELLDLEAILNGKINLDLIRAKKTLRDTVRGVLYQCLQRVVKEEDVFKD